MTDVLLTHRDHAAHGRRYADRFGARLWIHDNVTWYSITELASSLARSVERLHFEWLLPGHGDRKRLPADEMMRRLHAWTARIKKRKPQPVDLSATRG